MLESIQESPRTQVFYEAPHRVKEAVEDIVEVLGAERHIVIAREVTKIHEEFLRGRASEVLQTLNTRAEIKGEITLLIGKQEETEMKTLRLATVRKSWSRSAEEKLMRERALKRSRKDRGFKVKSVSGTAEKK
jgi:16S rRNA (cytidine1402-2'-O)-methyltransferase